MTAAGDTADLLRPVLTERDDFTGFHRPWSPWTLLVLTVVGGPIGGGYLYAENARRLGERRGAIALTALGFVVLTGLLLLAFERIDREAQPLLFRLATTGTSAVGALVAASFQRRRHQLYVSSGGEHGKLAAHAVPAVVIGIVGLGLLGTALKDAGWLG